MALDQGSLFQYALSSAIAHIGRRQILQGFMIALVVVVVNKAVVRHEFHIRLTMAF